MKNLNITFEDKEFERMRKSREAMMKRLAGMKISWKDYIMAMVAFNEIKFDEVKGGKKR